MEALTCPGCNKTLNPANHGELVCDGEVWCDTCRLYDRRLIQPREFEEIQDWSRRVCEAFGVEPVTLVKGDERPPAGPFDFLDDKKLLMAEADHREGEIVLYPGGQRLATLCHELAHLMTGQDHTADWAKAFARLVAWVREQLPEGHFTAGFWVNLLESK